MVKIPCFCYWFKITIDFKINFESQEPSYRTSYKSKLESLKIEVQKLEDIKNSVQDSVDEGKRNGEVIASVVEIWLKKVDATVAEAKKLISENGVHANCMRYFPNLWFRHQQSKKFQKMTHEIHQVQAEGIFEKIYYSKPSTLEEIQQALKDPNIFKIGLYGIDGVGKTTLVKELAQKVKNDGSFDVVVVAEVTDDSPDVENIQGQIAHALGLNFDEKTKEERVGLLRERIKKKKNILVILEDIWGKLDLAEVGIPFGDDYKGCKLLMTSRSLDMLKRQMDTQKDFKLERLFERDSWSLFKKIIVGGYVLMKNIESIARDVAKCCDGLPLFIVAVAKALQGKDVSTWEDALNKLKRFDEQGLSKEFVCPLELCYHYLESDTLKSFFLFIASFGLDRVHIGELFSCYWGLNEDSDTTEARNEFYYLINNLRASSLLLESEIEYVRMHVIIRDMAEAYASRTDMNYELQKFTRMEQWDMDKLQNCHYINLPSYDIDELPEKLDCPKLKLMSIRRNLNHGYLTIPDGFFSGMREVKVLNLHGIRFAPSPPSSLCHLINLITLNLYGCVLEDISMVAELKRLEILTIERSEIQELPKELGQLVYLRMLNLTNCCQLKTIPANVLSSLTRLEELYMGNCNIQWEVEEGKGQTNNASLSEVMNLYKLTTLDLSIQDATILPKVMNVFEYLQRYNIFIGNTWEWSSLWSGDARENSRTFKLDYSLITNVCLDSRMQLMFSSVEDLSLAKLNLVNDVSYELNGESFPRLRHLHIQNSTEAFHNLEKLILRDLEYMEDISYSPLPTHSFQKLQVITVSTCLKLKKLLLYSLAKNLSELHEMEIYHCINMEEVIFEEKSEHEKEIPNITLPKLRCLMLCSLFKLRCFSLPLTAEKDEASTPVPLFNQKVAFPNLEILSISSMFDLKSIWKNQQAPNSFNKLNKIRIDCCAGLHHVFPIVVAKELRQLQVLTISYCENIETIVENSDSSGDAHEIASTKLVEQKAAGSGNRGEAPVEIVFMKLEELKLSYLPRFTSFCKTSYNFNFPALQRVIVFDCPNMKTFCHGNVITPGLSKVTYMKTYGKDTKDIWYGNLNTTL